MIGISDRRTVGRLIDAPRVLREANGLNLARVKVSNPVSQWFKMTFGQRMSVATSGRPGECGKRC